MSVLVLDVGTTSMRGILYAEDGQKLCVCQKPNHVVFGQNGTVSEPTADWRDNTTDIMRAIAEDPACNPEEIASIAITSQRSSIIPVDADGTPLTDTIMWQDIRNKAICDELAAHNELCFAKTGARVNTVFSGSKMTWVRTQAPEIYEKTAHFVNIPEYINLLMSGEYCSDYTYASRSGLMNLRQKTWDEEMLDLYRVEKEKLNRLIEPGQICGRVSAKFAAQTGLPAGIPIRHCGGDQQCAAVGLGVTKPGNVSVVLGTGGFLITACDQIPENLRSDVICNCSGIAGKYVIEANVLACSAAYDWFIREFYGMQQIDYGYIEQQLSGLPGVTDALVIPYFKGRGVPDWNTAAKAAFLDVTLATTRQELLKSLMESIFMELANQLETFRQYVVPERIFASGGLTRSAALGRLLADVTGLPIAIRDDKESTAWGAYLIARTGMGDFASVDEASRALGTEEAVCILEPDESRHAQYELKRSRMNTYYQKLNETDLRFSQPALRRRPLQPHQGLRHL